MRCPKCQGNTKVLDTRSPSSTEPVASQKTFLNHGERIFGWWSNDFRVRKRRCESCDLRFLTIEVALRDLEDAFKEAMQGDLASVLFTTHKKPDETPAGVPAHP